MHMHGILLLDTTVFSAYRYNNNLPFHQNSGMYSSVMTNQSIRVGSLKSSYLISCSMTIPYEVIYDCLFKVRLIMN